MKTNEKTKTLIVRRMVYASREKIFSIMTDPTLLHRWLNGAEHGTCSAVADIRVGGKFAMTMVEGANVYKPHGEYLEISAPEKIRFTWISEGFVDYSEVTIELNEVGDATEVILCHELPEDPDLHKAHRGGWSWCLSRLGVHAELGTEAIPRPPKFEGGKNIALKISPLVYEQTVSFYRDVLGLEIIEAKDNSTCFQFGSMALWLDNCPGQTQTDIWLEVTTPDLESSETHFRRHRVSRHTKLEEQSACASGLFVTNPSGVVHLVSKS